MYELIAAYLHIKTPFRVIYDVVHQFEDMANPVEPDNNTIGLERSKEAELKNYAETYKHSKIKQDCYSQSEHVIFDEVNQRMQMPFLNYSKSNSVSCSFDYAVTDR